MSRADIRDLAVLSLCLTHERDHAVAQAAEARLLGFSALGLGRKALHAGEECAVVGDHFTAVTAGALACECFIPLSTNVATFDDVTEESP